MALSDYQTLVDELVRADTGAISTAARDRAIGLAVLRYDQDRPRELVVDQAIASATSLLLDLPAGWLEDFSKLVSIEYPLGASPPSLISGADVYRTPTGLKILLPQAYAVATVLRTRFTVRNTLDGSTDTIAVQHREPVASWAAAILLEQLSAKASGDTDSTIAADKVDRASPAREYAARAASLRKRYFAGIGVDPERQVPAGTVAQMPFPTSRAGGRLLRLGRWP